MLAELTRVDVMKILLPVDGSNAAVAAIRYALRLVRDGLSAEMVLVNVQEPPSLYEVVTAHDTDVLRHVRSDAGADLLAPAEALLDAGGVSWQSEVAGGQPGAMLIELLENYGCDAVVMGARGVGDPGAGGLGSVAQSLLDHSPVPVTVVRSAADDADAPTESTASADDESTADGQ
jgi:nucleotide-binding universal stress UspA family protein